MEWEILIKEVNLQRKVSYKIEQIADSLEQNYSNIRNLDLMYGKAGIILFFFYYDIYKNSKRFSSQISNFYEDIVQDHYTDGLNLSYAQGFSGILWLLFFINKETTGKKRIDNDTLKLIVNYSKDEISVNKNLDFMHGAIGTVFLINEFLNNNNSNYRKLELLLNKIKKIAHENNDYFILPPNGILMNGKKIFNLGLAHGLSSFIITLCMIYDNYERREIKEIINKSIKFLLSFKNINNFETTSSIYPSYIEYDEMNNFNPSRLSWCYGDLGNALAIYRASKSLNDNKLLNDSIKLFSHNTKRKEQIDSFVNDAEFCHGSVGIAHIYNRIYQETKIKEFKDTSLFWYLKTLDYATYDINKCAGYKTYKREGLIEDYSLLDGISGIGLALISSITNIEPKWDRSILLS